LKEIQTIPTNNHRHATKVRLGKLPEGTFSRAWRETIGVDPDVSEDRTLVVSQTILGGEGKSNASQKSKTAEMGIRSEGGEMDEEASLRQSEKEKTRKKIRNRKRTNAS
jgi:hypothetical protein